MDFTDFTQLLLDNTVWFFIGLIFYYILSFFKVHLLWKIQSRVWSNQFEKNIFKGYFPYALKSFFTDIVLHKMTFTYIFKYNKEKFPLEDIDKTKGIKKGISILESLTLFLKPFLFFALVFAVLRFWIAKRFLYDELTITLGGIQKLINILDSLTITKFLNKHKALVFLILGCITVCVPYIYTRDSLRKKFKKGLKYVIVSIAILIHVSFFGTLTGKTTSQKTEELSSLALEITDIHDKIYRDLFIEILPAEIETALKEEETLYNELYKTFEKKVEKISNEKNRDTEIQTQLIQKLSSKLKDLKKFTFNVEDFNTSDQKTYKKNKRRPKSNYTFYDDLKNEKTYASYNKYQDYIGSKEKWNKKRGTTIRRDIKSIITTPTKNSFKDKLKEIAGHIVDYGYEITSSIFFEELDISSQKTLKKIISIVTKENLLTKINDKIARSIDKISSSKLVKEILQTNTNTYTYSKESIKELKKESLTYYNSEVNKAQKKQNTINRKKQEAINRKKLLTELDEKIYSEVNNMINSFDMVKNITTNEYTQYKMDIVNAYKKDLNLKNVTAQQISQILTATTEMQLKIKQLFNPSNSTIRVTHPGPVETCPICAFNLIKGAF